MIVLDELAVSEEYLTKRNDIINDRLVVHPDIHVVNRYNNLAASAEGRGLEFNISVSEIKRLMSRKTCFYSGLKFDRTSDTYRQTFDRINRDIGYVSGNVVVCCNIINQVKANLIENNKSFFCGNPHLLAKVVKGWVAALDTEK